MTNYFEIDMYKLEYGIKHKQMLLQEGISDLLEAQESWNSNSKKDLIRNCILPHALSNDEEAEIAEDLITMITSWEIGQTEAYYDELDVEEDDEKR